MIKYRAWWFDVLLVAVVVVSCVAVTAEGPLPWLPASIGLTLLVAGYVIVRPRLSRSKKEARTWVDWVGCTATVKTHMEHILAKLGATTRTQAVLLAHQSGFLTPPAAPAQDSSA